MEIRTAMINDEPFDYAVVKAAIAWDSSRACAMLMPHRQGWAYLAICRECGFGVGAGNEGEAAHYLTASTHLSPHEHTRGAFAYVQFDPTLIDHIYEAFNLETAGA